MIQNIPDHKCHNFQNYNISKCNTKGYFFILNLLLMKLTFRKKFPSTFSIHKILKRMFSKYLSPSINCEHFHQKSPCTVPFQFFTLHAFLFKSNATKYEFEGDEILIWISSHQWTNKNFILHNFRFIFFNLKKSLKNVLSSPLPLITFQYFFLIFN